MRLIVVVAIGGLLFGQAPDAGGVASSSDVSMVQLLVDPERYNGKRVRLIGVGAFDEEESALFLHREDFDQSNASNAVWLSWDPGQQSKILTGKWLLVEGTFVSERRGHHGEYPGAIVDLGRVVSWPGRSRRR